MEVGLEDVGTLVGEALGPAVVGNCVGDVVGSDVVGTEVGLAVAFAVGLAVGLEVGLAVGHVVGSAVVGETLRTLGAAAVAGSDKCWGVAGVVAWCEPASSRPIDRQCKGVLLLLGLFKLSQGV